MSTDETSTPPPDDDPDAHATTGYTPITRDDSADPPLTPPVSAEGSDQAPTREYTPGGIPITCAGTGEATPGYPGAPLSSAPPNHPSPPTVAPVRAGRYALLRFHAKGGMGEVWLAEDCDFGRPVALKRMPREGNPAQQERFLREARITGQLEHPGIVPVHELGTDADGQPIYVMKFVQGRTLSEAIKEYRDAGPTAAVPREMRQLRLLQVFVALCHTIAYAHSRGVLHRDIKPDNVMLGPYGETLVLDWGLGKVLGHGDTNDGSVSLSVDRSGESMESEEGTVKGTPGYMSPEMARGRSEEVDQRSDVYLLGATLYQILTGQRPRSGKGLKDMLTKATTIPPPAPRTLDASIPRALEAVCLKAMAWEKADRYPEASALAEDVQRYLAGEPVSAYREGLATCAWRWARRHRRALTRGAVAALLLAMGLGGFFTVREAFERRDAALRLAAQQSEENRRKDEARQSLIEFHRLADETSYYLANATPTTEQTPYYDPLRGASTGRKALELADKLSDLPLADLDQESVHERRYDLLLLLAQSVSRPGSSDGASQALVFLEQASAFHSPTSGLHKLRAECYTRLDDSRADQERKAAESERVPTTALDHFLEGERFRAESVRPARARKGLPDWDQNADLLAKALQEYRAALRLSPDHYWAHYQMGQCHVALGEYAEGSAELGTCITLQPRSPWGYVARGIALAHLNRFAEAEADLDAALKADPNLEPARLNSAVVHWLQHDPEKEKQARADLDAVLTAPAEKRLVEAAFVRAQMAHEHGREEDALRDLDQVIAEKPEFRSARRARALILLARGDHARGLDDLTAYLAGGRPLDPASAEACEGRGRLLRLLVPQVPEAARPALLKLALAEFRKASDLGARSANFLDDYASVLDSLGEYGPAVEKYTEALKLAPDDAKVLVKRAWARVNNEQVAAAEDDFRELLKRDPTHPEAHTGVGYVLALRKESAPALREAHLATLYGAGDYVIVHNIACIYAALARNDPVRRKEYQDLALDSLSRAVDLWKRVGKPEPNEMDLIKGESAFDANLRARKEFPN